MKKLALFSVLVITLLSVSCKKEELVAPESSVLNSQLNTNFDYESIESIREKKTPPIPNFKENTDFEIVYDSIVY